MRALDSFYKTLTNEPLKAFYGEKHVFRAAEAQAIEVLLISDKLFRARVRNKDGFPCPLWIYFHNDKRFTRQELSRERQDLNLVFGPERTLVRARTSCLADFSSFAEKQKAE